MPFFIPASIIIPALAKTTAEVSGWLILEYCTLGSVGAAGILYYAGAFNKPQRFTPLQIDETPLQQVSLSIQNAILRTNESVLQLCKILSEVKEHTHQICADDKVTDEVCQHIRLHLKDIGSSMDSIRQLFQELKAVSAQDGIAFSQTVMQIKVLEKTLEVVQSQSLEKIEELEEELKAKDTSIQNFFEMNQVLKDKLSSLTPPTLSNR